MRRNLRSFILHSFFLLPGTIFAITPDTLHRQLNAVNIIATRTEKSTLETPRSVTVLTKSELQQAPYITLGDLLQEQAGCYVVGSGQAPGSNQSLFLRGANSNQTAIFIDGVRIVDVSTINGVADLSELPLSGVERVEILRGAQGTLYGSPACGGVIRITTADSSRKSGYHGNFGARGGIFSEKGWDFGTSAMLSFRSQKGWYVKTSSDFFSSGGFNATLDTGFIQPDLRPDADPWEKSTTVITTGYASDKYSINLNYRYLKSSTAIDASAYKDDDNYTLDFRRHLLSIDFSGKVTDRLSFSFNASRTSTERNALNDSSVSLVTGTNDRTWFQDQYTGRQSTSELLFHYRSPIASITGGTSVLFEQMDQQNDYYSALYDPFILSYSTSFDTLKPDALSQAVFLHADLSGKAVHRSLERFNLLLGIRGNNHAICGMNTALECSPSVRIGSSSLAYASFSTGFTTPSLYQLFAPDTYYPWDGQTPSGLTRGNKTLVPEQTRSFEIGFKQQFGSSAEWEVCVFRSVTRHLIDYVYLWDSSVPIPQLGTDFNRDDYRGDLYVNLGDQTAYGAEATVTLQLSRQFRVKASGSLLDGYLQLKPSADNRFHYQSYATGIFLGDARYDGLLRRPSTYRGSVEYRPTESNCLQLQVRHTGNRPDVYYDSSLGPYGALNRKSVDGYTLTDLSASWIPGKDILLNLRIENLFDVGYQEIFGFRTRGRGLQIGAVIGF